MHSLTLVHPEKETESPPAAHCPQHKKNRRKNRKRRQSHNNTQATANSTAIQQSSEDNNNTGHPGWGPDQQQQQQQDLHAVLNRQSKGGINFQKYYKHQLRGVIGQEEEWQKFLTALETPLPSAMRINRNVKDKEKVIERLKHWEKQTWDQIELRGGRKAKGPSRLEWYPDELGWEVDVPRMDLKRNQQLQELQEYLVYHHDLGNISRQEEVSMIPALFLDLKENLAVLDMCASPGSKTQQILEIMSYASTVVKENEKAVKESGGPQEAQAGSAEGDDHHASVVRFDQDRSGIIVANDIDVKRCGLLTHRMKRFAYSSLCVTNHDGRTFPIVRTFDRVLCDVPCSGDGTFRKAPDIWAKWTIMSSLGVHKTQIDIASRGFEVLKPGGRMVYSTCSFNPIENEAVVAELLRRFPSQLKVLDVSDSLTKLKRRAGILSWSVTDDVDCHQFYNYYDEVPQPSRRKIVQSMFPPGDTEEELCIAQQLKLCLRVMPHDQNTGGFFVTVIEKRMEPTEIELANQKETKSPPLKVQKTDIESVTISHEMSEKKTKENREFKPKKVKKSKESLYKELFESFPDKFPDAALKIGQEYGIDERYLTFAPVSEEEKPKYLYVMSRELQSTVKISYERKCKEKGSYNMMNTGIKVFERTNQRGNQEYRIHSSGIYWMIKNMKKKLHSIKIEDFKRLLEQGRIENSSISDQDQEILKSLSNERGTIVLYPEDQKEDAVIFWKGPDYIETHHPRAELNATRRRYEISTS